MFVDLSTRTDVRATHVEFPSSDFLGRRNAAAAGSQLTPLTTV